MGISEGLGHVEEEPKFCSLQRRGVDNVCSEAASRRTISLSKVRKEWDLLFEDGHLGG